MRIKKFLKRENGQGLVEYALILVLVAIVVLAILLVLGPQVGGVFSNVVANFNRVTGGGGQTVEIQQFSVSASGGATNCNVTLNQLMVRVRQAGQPAAGVSVTVTVTLQGGHSKSFTVGPTNSGGIASISGGSIGSEGGACGGKTATASAAGATKTAGY